MNAADSESQDAESPLRGLVVGGGSIGLRHWRNLKSLGVEAAIIEPSAARREVLAAECGTLFEDPRQGFDYLRAEPSSPRFAVIASPTDSHIGDALMFARVGCDLMIEKPLGCSIDKVLDLLSEIEYRRLVSLVACNMRFHPGPLLVRQFLTEGRIGTPIAARLQCGSYLPKWRPAQDYRQSYSASTTSGGAILDCIHEIDLALWLLGPAKCVGSAWIPAASIGLETDGLAEIILRHDSGALSNVHLNFIQRDYRRSIQLIGTEGTLYWDFAAAKVDRFNAEGVLAESAVISADWRVDDMYVDEMKHFLECVRDRKETTNSVFSAAATLAIALEAKHSDWKRAG